MSFFHYSAHHGQTPPLSDLERRVRTRRRRRMQKRFRSTQRQHEDNQDERIDQLELQCARFATEIHALEELLTSLGVATAAASAARRATAAPRAEDADEA